MPSKQLGPAIMIICNIPEDTKILRDVLQGEGYNIKSFKSGPPALKSAAKTPPDLILIDMQWPETDPFKVYRSLKTDTATKDVPVLFVDDSGHISETLLALELNGVDDVLSRTFQAAEVMARIKQLLSRKEKIRALESLNSHLESQLKERCREQSNGAAHFRQIVTVANEGIILTDADLRIIYVNDAMTKLLRCAPKDIIGRKKIGIIPDSERKEFRERIVKRKKGQAEQLQIQINLLDGDTRWVQISSAPIMGEKNRFQGLVVLFTDIHDRKREQDELASAYEKINALKQQLEADNLYLQEEIKLEHSSDMIIGESDVMNYAFFRMNQVAKTDATVIVLGETGTGKELFARALHSASRRSQRPLIKVDCAALPEQLIESELFGHVKGAFTGAERNRMGRFELAHNSTLFLDEIGELSLASQAKLLRFLQEGEFEQVGDSRTIKSDVRIIAATNRDMTEQVNAGRFRSDLWHRLKVFPITLPPLRERKEDIPLLVNHFINKIGKRIGREIKSIPRKTMEQLSLYDWPGNIRELEHVLERTLILSPGSRLVLTEKLINESHQAASEKMMSHAEMERHHIVQALEQTSWVVEGPKGAARILKLHPNTLRYRMKKHNISRPP